MAATFQRKNSNGTIGIAMGAGGNQKIHPKLQYERKLVQDVL